MSQPIAVNILSDDEDGDHGSYDGFNGGAADSDAVCIDLVTPLPSYSKKKQRLSDPSDSNPSASNACSTVLVIDDDPTPSKHLLGTTSTPSIVAETPPFSSRFSKLEELSIFKCSKGSSGVNSTPSFVAETPILESSRTEVPIVKCCGFPDSCTQLPLNLELKSSESRLLSLESDNGLENLAGSETWKPDETTGSSLDMEKVFGLSSRFVESSSCLGEADIKHMSVMCSPCPNLQEDDISQVPIGDENDSLEYTDKVIGEKGRRKVKAIMKKGVVDAKAEGRMSKEERLRLKEERKQQREQEKLKKASQKAEAAELKKLEKEKQKWEKGKFALKSIVAKIDTRVVEVGSIGGHLLTRFAEKGLSFRITSNPIERSIIWTMTVPEELSKISSDGMEIPYILLVYEAEEFCNLVTGGTLMDHVSRIQLHYPCHTLCFLTNRLMAYINKRDQNQYKNPTGNSGWKRPAIEEVLAKLTTHFFRVHSRQCVDEAELADHVIGLTCSLASCQFRKKLTRLSVNANGSLVPKDCTDRNLIKKDLWLKALIAIPKVQPQFAIAIRKKYPTMKSLLSIYMDPSKSVHEKEFLLRDLTTEGLLGDDRRVGEVCSKRVYRILMAQCGSIRTDDVENGADFFHHQT